MDYGNSHHKRKKRRDKKAYRPKPPFSPVEGIMSAAYEKLSPNAVCVLIEFYRKFNGFNRYDLSLTRKDVQNKMSHTTLSKSIWELISYGFIDVVRWGALEKNCSIYGLSHRWKNLSNSPQELKTINRLLNQIEKKRRDKTDNRKREKIRAMRVKILKVCKW